MILAAATRNGRTVLIVGLSAENVRRLQANEPIDTRVPPGAGLDCDLVIFGGRGDEEDLRARLAEVVELPDERRHP